MDSRPARECRRWNYIALKTQEFTKGSAFLFPLRNPRKPENPFQDRLRSYPRKNEGDEERETRAQKERANVRSRP